MVAAIVPTPSESTITSTESSIRIPKVKKIRVLLNEHDMATEKKFIIKAANGFILESPAESGNTALYQKGELHLLCKNDNLYLRCHDHQYRRIKYNNIEICDTNNKITIGSYSYQGSLIIQLDKTNKKVLVINKLPLEDYVYSVVRYESIPSWPLNSQKIQAIVSRTYAVFLMQQARQNKLHPCFYDIKNTTMHQVYNGTHNYNRIRQAIDETAGMIITYKGHIALTMFDSCCGGSVPSLMYNRETSKPYLCRHERCLYCQKSPSFRWKIDLPEKALLGKLKASQHLARKLKSVKAIKDIKVVKVDKAGLVLRVAITDQSNRTITIAGNDMRWTMSSRIKSLSFSVKKIRDRIVIAGKGYGHQRGLCQWGSNEQVHQGRNIRDILSFYYPGTKISKLL